MMADNASITQIVSVESGFGYGLIGADLHVFRDRGPVYVLTQHQRHFAADPTWLPEQPSRLLDVRHRVVAFTGREGEMADLSRWRDGRRSRLSAMWLHGPGGAGKTRLAVEFADASAAANWKVVRATHGPGAVTPPPGSQDLRVDGAAGLLVVVDYADRWPLSHLRLFLSNALLSRSVPTRLLLLARSAYSWPVVRDALRELDALTSDRLLDPLPPARERMFVVARDAFAARYRLADASQIPVPPRLGDSYFSLTLTVHMAALVAVDVHARGDDTATDPAALSAYLLDREYRYWTHLYENRLEGSEFGTAPSSMARLVFTAALTGAIGYGEGARIVQALDLPGHTDRLLDDHAICYPSVEPGTVLEPLYPDRLAEDFLALTLPGHAVRGYASGPWAPETTAKLVLGEPMPYLSRAMTFLAAAAAPGRWPHVGRHLADLLRAQPTLAVAGGGAALSALAQVEDLDPGALAAIVPHLPERAQADLDLGIAAVTQRMTDEMVAAGAEAVLVARQFTTLAQRYVNAGLHEQGLEASRRAAAILHDLPDQAADRAASALQESRALHALGRRDEALSAIEMAVQTYREVAATDPDGCLPHLAASLNVLGRESSGPGTTQRAVAAAEESVGIYRQLAQRDPQTYLPDLATALNGLTVRLMEAHRQAEAFRAARDAIKIRRDLAQRDPATFLADLATSLNNLGQALPLIRREEALAVTREAVDIRRQLAQTNPHAYQAALGVSLNNLGLRLDEIGRDREAEAAFRESVAVYRMVAETNPAAYRQALALSVYNLASSLGAAGRDEALALGAEAIDIFRSLAHDHPDFYLPSLAAALHNHGVTLALVSSVRQNKQALVCVEEAVAIRRKLAEADPERLPELAISLENLETILRNLGRNDKAAAPAREAAEIRRLPAAKVDPMVEAVFDSLEDDSVANLAAALEQLGAVPAERGQAHESLESIERAADAYRQLAATDPDIYLPRLARVLSSQCVALLTLQQPDSAADAAKAMVAILRQLAEEVSARYRPELARGLYILALALGQKGEFAEAAEPATESMVLYRQLGKQTPGAFKTELFEVLSLRSQLQLGPTVAGKIQRRLLFGSTLADRMGITTTPVLIAVTVVFLVIGVAVLVVLYVVTLPRTIGRMIWRRVRGSS